jgi:hypothetical protein
MEARQNRKMPVIDRWYLMGPVSEIFYFKYYYEFRKKREEYSKPQYVTMIPN